MKSVKWFVAGILLTILNCASVFAQNQEIKGLVTDEETGEPIPFASVMVKGTTIGVSADADGIYKISVPVGADHLLSFSSIGYLTQDIPVGSKLEINVSLLPDVNTLEETMVVAFGTATKESFTGSAAVVKSSDIAKVQSTNATRALEGTVAGVQMTTVSGMPGASPSIVIRGISSISAGSDPLYIVDGAPYAGSLSNINPADIESMTVLKDAASNALYGARGANGVIMITTKKAKTQDAIVNFDMKLGWNSKALREYDYIKDPAQYYELHYKALKNYQMNQGLADFDAHLKAESLLTGSPMNGGLGYNVYDYPDNELLIGYDGKINPHAKLGRVVNYNGQDYLMTPDDWLDEAYRNSMRQEYNLSVTGRNDKTSFYASVGYLKDNGIVRNSDIERITGRLKADYQAKTWLKMGANAAFTHTEMSNGNGGEGEAGSTANIFSAVNAIAPIYPLYIRDGSGQIMYDKYGYQRYDWGDRTNAGMERPALARANPFQLLELDKSTSEGNSFNVTGFAEVTFLKDFKVTVNAGFALNEARATNLKNNLYGQFVASGGAISKAHSRSTDFNLQELISYDKTIGVHHISALLGHENYNAKTYGLSAIKNKIVSLDNLELGGAVIDGKGASSSFGEYNSEGYFLRAQYDYDNRVFTSVSYRRDASSRFHPKHRWGNFWSVGAGWLINHEPWFNASWVDMLKIKASIGSQGNDNIPNYLYMDMYEVTNSNDQVAIGFMRKGNENITWETNTNFNVGADFEFLQGKISGGVEYFYRKTSDMLFLFTVPASLGYSGYYDNIGDMRNAGVELSLNFNPIRKRDLNWNIYLNMTHYKNKITMLPSERKTRVIEGHGGFASGNRFLGEGLALNTFLLPKYAGVEPSTGLPMWYKDVYATDDKGNVIKDGSGNPVVSGRETTTKYSDATEYLCGDPTPAVYGGFGTSLDFHGFDFSIQFTYQIGGLAYDNAYASLMDSPNPQGKMGGNFHKDILNAWTPQNTGSNVPRFVYSDNNIAASSDRFLTDASYLNIQNAQLGYTLPHNLTRKIKIDRIRIYVACDNIAYFSRRRGLDPRQSISGATSNEFTSPVRTLSGGLTVTF